MEVVKTMEERQRGPFGSMLVESGAPFSPSTCPVPSSAFIEERTSGGRFSVASEKRARAILVVSLSPFEEGVFHSQASLSVVSPRSVMQATGIRSGQWQVICLCAKLPCRFQCRHPMHLLSKEENETNSCNK